MAFRDPEDLNKDVTFDVKILRENWHARQATKIPSKTLSLCHIHHLTWDVYNPTSDPGKGAHAP